LADARDAVGLGVGAESSDSTDETEPGAEQRPCFSQLFVRLLSTVSAQMAPPPRAHSSPQKKSHQLPETQYMSHDISS
jgi:hypothetical protein